MTCTISTVFGPKLPQYCQYHLQLYRILPWLQFHHFPSSPEMLTNADTVSPGSRSHFATTLALFILSTSQDDQKHTVSSLKLQREVVTHLIGRLRHYIPYMCTLKFFLVDTYFTRWSVLAKLKAVKFLCSMRFWFLAKLHILSP